MTGYDALVLAGGQAARLGGVDKPAVKVGDVTMLDRVLAAVSGATRRIVVGGQLRPQAADVCTCEEPPGGGPVAAIAAGLPHVGEPVALVLAADLPFLTAGTVEDLLAGLATGVDAAVLVDEAGRDQLLLALWRTAALRSRLAVIGGPAGPAGRPVRELFDTVPAARIPGGSQAGQPPPWLDCDTAEDLRRAREWT